MTDYDGGQQCRQQVLQHVAGLNSSQIKVVTAHEKCTLGALRNLAVSQAAGEILCQWDDDDLHHPRRLESQLRCLQDNNASACLLGDYLHYFPQRKALFWCDYSRDGGLPGTIMFKAGLGVDYPEAGSRADKGEDEAFQRQMIARHRTMLLRRAGYLYGYVYHGRNTWSAAHHGRLAKSLALPFDFIRPRLKPLYRELRTQMEDEFPIKLLCRGGERIEFRSPAPAATAE